MLKHGLTYNTCWLRDHSTAVLGILLLVASILLSPCFGVPGIVSQARAAVANRSHAPPSEHLDGTFLRFSCRSHSIRSAFALQAASCKPSEALLDVFLHPCVSLSLYLSQVTNPVQFEQSLANVMGKGFEYGYECGPGKVVAGILKRVDKKAQMTNIQV